MEERLDVEQAHVASRPEMKRSAMKEKTTLTPDEIEEPSRSVRTAVTMAVFIRPGSAAECSSM